jgi:hypothetical protein
MRRICALAALCSLPLAVMAQPSGVPLPANAAKPKPADPGKTTPNPAGSAAPNGEPAKSPTLTTAFDATPLTLDDPPLTMLIPKGSKSDVQHAGGVAEIQITSPDKGWIMRVHTRVFGDRSMTTSEVMKAQLAAIEKSDQEDGAHSTVIDKSKLAMVAGRPAERVYLEIPSRDGKTVTIRGITIFKSQPGSFVFAELLCDRSRYDTSRVTYEETLTKLSVADPTASEERVAALVKAGAGLLASVTDEDLKAIVNAKPDRWERFYQPAPDGSEKGATEIGYRRVQTGYGRRSQFSQFGEGSADDSTGYFVRIDSRVRIDQDLVDMQGIFYLSTDRKDELWTLTLALKTKAKTIVTREVGARHGDSMTVTTTDGNGMTKGRPIQATIPPEGYLSRVEHYLLQQILVRKGVTADFGFYSYNHDDHRIRLRTDQLSPEKSGKVFELTSSLKSLGGEKTLVQTARLRDNGDLIEQTMADGSTWEPTTVQRLLDLWKSKGLPLN